MSRSHHLSPPPQHLRLALPLRLVLRHLQQWSLRLHELRLPENEAIDDSLSASDRDSEVESVSGTLSAEGDFDPQGVFDDWVVSLRAYDRKILSISLLETLRARQGLTVVDAAKESTSFPGYNERTVRRYPKQFFEGKGKLEETRQGNTNSAAS